MLIRAGYEIELDFPAPTAMTLLLNVLPSRSADLKHPDKVKLSPDVPHTEFIDWFGNKCVRLLSPEGRLLITNDTVIEDPGVTVPSFPELEQHPIHELPDECLQFLLPSRYCEVDELTDIAWNLFGDQKPGWSQVQEICTWVNNHITFGYQHASSTKTAVDVYEQKLGVCRDFTHLALTFCRAMGYPARYATGYLGDIDFPVSDSAMDFSACFQVYIGGKWHIFDARHKVRRVGWILIATGRDAADCAITTTFGPHKLSKFVVWTDEVKTAELTAR